MTAEAGRRYVGQVLEVRYRLQRIWKRVVEGELPWWRAAGSPTTPCTSPRRVRSSWTAGSRRWRTRSASCTPRSSATKPSTSSTPSRPRSDAKRRRSGVGSTCTWTDAGRHGTVDIEASADTADAIDLDTAIAQAAEQLAANGSTDTLDVRRSQALGVIARHYLGDPAQRRPRGPVRWSNHGRSPSTSTSATPTPAAARRPGHRSRSSRRASWCTNPDTQVDHQAHPGPQRAHPGRRLRSPRPTRRADHRTRRHLHPPLVHPPSQRCDKDHCQPFDRGGTTCTHNLAPLCRRHHRAKTHAGWTYRFLRPGAYLWRSPGGHWYHRDGTGTTDLGHLASTSGNT